MSSRMYGIIATERNDDLQRSLDEEGGAGERMYFDLDEAENRMDDEIDGSGDPDLPIAVEVWERKGIITRQSRPRIIEDADAVDATIPRRGLPRVQALWLAAEAAGRAEAALKMLEDHHGEAHVVYNDGFPAQMIEAQSDFVDKHWGYAARVQVMAMIAVELANGRTYGEVREIMLERMTKCPEYENTLAGFVDGLPPRGGPVGLYPHPSNGTGDTREIHGTLNQRNDETDLMSAWLIAVAGGMAKAPQRVAAASEADAIRLFLSKTRYADWKLEYLRPGTWRLEQRGLTIIVSTEPAG